MLSNQRATALFRSISMKKRSYLPLKRKKDMEQKVKEITLKMKDLEIGCIWHDCNEHFPLGQMPDDWVNLLVWGGQTKAGATISDVAFSPTCYRDAALCPKHAREFLAGGSLKPIPPKGTM